MTACDPLRTVVGYGNSGQMQGATSVSMNRIASSITSWPAWQAFLFTCIPFFGAGYVAMPEPGQPGSVVEMEVMFSRMMLILMPVALILYSWIWSIGNVANRAASDSAKRPERFFNFALPYAFAYLVFAYFFFPSPGKMENPPIPVGLVMILHVLAVVCTFYAVASSAMRLKSFEAGNRVGFGGSFGTFFLIWFFPLGVWFVQPRANKASAALETAS